MRRMSIRFGLHLGTLVVLAALGSWIVWRALSPQPAEHAAVIGGVQAASYWFAFLIYGLLASILYLFVRRRSVRALVIAHVVSALLAVVATVSLVMVSHQHEARRQLEIQQELEQVPPVTPEEIESTAPPDQPQ